MRKVLKYLLITGLVLFVLLNGVAVFYSYQLTHFDEGDHLEIVDTLGMSTSQRVKSGYLTFTFPKPKATYRPENISEINIPVDEEKKLSAWLLKIDSTSRGMVMMFHGYTDEKSSLFPKAEEIAQLGYDVLLPDFMGSGDSYGTQTTIGYLEAQNVITTYNYVRQALQPEGEVYVMGFSMGAVAVMKALHDEDMAVDGVILEAPYSTLRTTIASRARLIGLPAEPASSITTFWIGVVNGFNGFSMEPVRFAEKITQPTLLMFGKEDQYISEEEAQSIADAVASEHKTVHFFEKSIHESYLLKHPNEWRQVMQTFLGGATLD